MTTRTPMRPGRRDLPALHAAIAPSSALQGERRALYQFAADLLEGGSSRILDLDVIDSPLVRNRIGDALAGRSRFSYSALVGISAVADTAGATQDLPVASRPAANTLLAGALDDIGAQLGGQRVGSGPPGLLTTADGEQFASALAVLRDGVALAQSVSPELIEDLLMHVALVAILDPQRAGGLASASSRAFPGLIMLESPRSSIEAAEALVHEGAHQKLFDLAITHDLLNASSERCPPFHPPWAPEEHRWRLERTLAAGHAYACLDRFGQDAGVTSGTRAVGAGSLLPVAGERSKIIGQWLLGQGHYLGTDAHILLEGLLGRKPRTADTAPSHGLLANDYVIDTGWELRRCPSSNRVLVGRPAQPPLLYWVSEDAAALLELIDHEPLDKVVDRFAQRWQMSHGDVTDRLTKVLSDLSATGLLTPKGCDAHQPVTQRREKPDA